MPPGAAGTPDQCIALTTAGTRCSRPAGDDGFCYQHDASAETIDLDEGATGAAAEPSRPPRRRAGREADADDEPASPSPASAAVAEEPADEAPAAERASAEDESDALPPIDTDVPPREDAETASDDTPEEPAAAGDDDGDLAERLKRGTERRYRESRRLLEEQTEAVEASSRRGWAATKAWYATSVVPAVRSLREDLRQRWSRLTERRSTDRK